MVKSIDHDKIEFNSASYGKRTISASVIEELLTSYLKAVKQNIVAYPCIMASVKVNGQTPQNSADANRILNFLNGDKYTAPVSFKAYLFFEKSDYDKETEEAGRGNVIDKGKWLGKGIKDANGNEIDIEESYENILLAGNSEFMDAVNAANFKKGKSLEIIVSSIRQQYPWFVKGTGLDYKDFQKEIMGWK